MEQPFSKFRNRNKLDEKIKQMEFDSKLKQEKKLLEQTTLDVKKVKLEPIQLSEEEQTAILYYRHICTMFGLEQKNTSEVLMLLSQMITNDTQLVLEREQKRYIRNRLGLSLQRIEQLLADLKSAKLLFYIKRGLYSTHPYILPPEQWYKLENVTINYVTRTIKV